MKRIILVAIAIAVVLSLTVIGCTNKKLIGTPEIEQEVADTCVTCHTDKDTLKAVASPEEEKEASESTTGEG